MLEKEIIFTNQTNASSGIDKQEGIEVLANAINELRSIQKRDQWLLIDSNGNVFKGNTKAILHIIMQNDQTFHRSITTSSR